MKRKNINIGIIGCGHWGPNYVRNFNQIEQSSVIYICDSNAQRLLHLRQLYPKFRAITDYHQILHDKNIDAVVIATPVITHYKLSRDSLLNNKHVLVEKPMTMNIDEASDLISIAKNKRRIFMVGHTFKFNPAINKLKDIIENRELGKIYYIYSRRTNLGPLRKDVNAVWDLAPHDISILNYILGGTPLAVSAWGEKYLPHNLEDVSFIMLTFPHRVIAHVHVSWLDPKKTREIVVVGSKKMAIFDDLNQETPIIIYDKKVMKRKFRQNYDSFEEFQMIIKDGKVYIPKIKKAEPLKLECEHFIDCIHKNKTPKSDGRDGFHVLEVLLGIQHSLEKKGNRFVFKRTQ